MTRSFPSIDDESQLFSDSIVTALRERVGGHIVDTAHSSLEEALAATPAFGVLEVRTLWERTTTWEIDKPVRVVFAGPGEIRMAADVSAVRVKAADVSLQSHRLTGLGGAGTAAGIEVGAVARFRSQGGSISSFSKYGIVATGADSLVIQENELTDIAYAGVMLLSCRDGIVSRNRVRNVLQPAPFTNSYGIAASRDSSRSLADAPRSARIRIEGNLIDGVPKWEGIDTHAGSDISIVGNTVINTNVGIALVPGVGTDGVDLYGPQGCLVSGNVIDSTVTNGSRGSGIQIVGAGTTLGAPTEAAAACVVTGNTVRRHGKEAGGANDGAISAYNTVGLVVSANSIIEGGVRGVHLYHDNQRGIVSSNTFVDTWSDTVAYTAAVHVSSTFNTMTLSGNIVARGVKTAAKVNDRGLFVGTGTSNGITDLTNDFDLCTTPVADTGNVSSVRMRAKKFGAYGVTPVTQPTVTGSVASGAAVKSLLAALATEGLIVNGSVD